MIGIALISHSIKNAILIVKDGTTIFVSEGRTFRLLFTIFHQPANIKTYIGFMLIYTKFHPDFMTYDVMTFYLEIFSNFFSAHSYCYVGRRHCCRFPH